MYDLSGVLEPAFRMSLGDHPYLDFPFPYAPLTFLIQAALIKLFGTVYWHHIAYAAAVAGFATLLTWRILASIFRDSFVRAAALSFVMACPLVILGVYCIFPHPFYDPDAAFVILFSILLLLRVERHGFPLVPAILTGMIVVVPLFIKQNIGLAYLGGISVWLMLSLIIGLWKKLPVRGHVALLGGIAVGLAAATVAIHFWVGLDNYKYWTWTFATARRSPSAADMLSVYLDPLLPLWLLLFSLGILFLWLNKTHRQLVTIAATLLMAIPFAWPAFYLLLDPDPSERAERLVNLWPIVLIASIGLSFLTVKRIKGFKRFLPFVLFCTAHGVFLSQQLWGSTYGIWPLFALMVAIVLFSINELTDRAFADWLVALGTVISVSLMIGGAFYVYSNERLDYIDLEDGDIAYSSLPQLKGLAVRGSYLPDFDELVKYTNENIPADDGVLELPGEDLFYYTTGRRPTFPTLLFDVTNNPYTAEQIADLARARNIRWLIVKQDLQIDVEKPADETGKPDQLDKTIDDKDHILEILKPEFKHIESLNNYEIYRRKLPGETDVEDEDDDDSGDDDSQDDSGN